ncbi:MAG: UbiD family decarboxylase [Alphaproteobacteria bacterium]|nr:UbiD family decarboxylase [Alphaproteobacteria bacterium]
MTGKNVQHRFAYDDLRQWVEEADKLGEMRYLKGMSWERDIGMVTELLHHTDPAPCALFSEVQGCDPSYRVLTNFFGARRKGMTLGFPADMTKLELTDGLAEITETKKPIPHKIVKDGPVFENILTGDAIDVTKFPTPKWHEEDGGRYIGTGSYNVTKDPDENWINTGTYRVMIHDKKTVGFYISPGKHGRIHRDKYMARGEKMPACIVVGGDPMMFLMASSEVPYGLCEYDLVGGYRGKPMECVQGKVTGLPFPANAELVIEGWIDPKEFRDEGPFGEWTGYYASDTRPEPIMHIEAIYHRNDPIILGCPPQRPPDELARYRAVARSALLKRSIQAAGVPDVTAVWADECGSSRMFVAVSIKQRYPGHARQVGHVACQCHVGAYAGKYVIVVDDDIDVSNLDEVMWAVVTRSDPATSIDIVKNAWSTPLDPRITPEQRATKDFTNSRAIIDACRPFHWRDQFPHVNIPSKELAKETRDKFSWVLDEPKTN